jgi:hypothetical protein
MNPFCLLCVTYSLRLCVHLLMPPFCATHVCLR